MQGERLSNGVANPAEHEQILPVQDRFREERLELASVLSHPEISRSSAAVRFLTFVCEKYFDGRSEEIREYSIAVEALGRHDVNFDSNIDPIVRVTARSLRKKLDQLYQSDWKDHELQIALPRGRYIPVFTRRDLPPSPACEPQVSREDGYEHSVEETDQLAETAADALSNSNRVNLRKPLSVALGLFLVAGIYFAGYISGKHAGEPKKTVSQAVAWGDPVWEDQFDGASGQAPDPSKWTFVTGSREQLGNQGWGTHEIQTYCAPRGANPPVCDFRHPNAFLDGNGHLVLRAERTSDGSWTSARMTTLGLKEFQYGRIEVRMKMPVGIGLWPTFWVIGSNFRSSGWPDSGSATIAENVSINGLNNGLGPFVFRSTLHGPGYYGGNALWSDFKLSNSSRVDDGFHIYGMIWSPGMIQFYFEDPSNVFFVRNSSDLPLGGRWVFDHPFDMVLNLAVGGDWAGNPEVATPNPSNLVVDYVRVYRNPTVLPPDIKWQPVQVIAGSSEASVVTLRAKTYSGRVHVSCSVEPKTASCALAPSTVDFSSTLLQEASLTTSTGFFTDNGRVESPPGTYKMTITATTISGDHSELTVPFEVKEK
jgi:beta-glucanase (GH16 family)